MKPPTNVLEQSRLIANFIGTPLHKANITVRGICWSRIKNRRALPDYLKGISTFNQLPRVNQNLATAHVVSVDDLHSSRIYERVDWIIENGKGQWNLTVDGFGFETHTDAVHYKLMFD